uniref:Protein serine/threonine phosphatase n=1 Tax=uncultured bacterium Contig178 TaxID=1393517 RepID=W0FQJ8_9BACT|nr:protein serine/threonine phosphatase [uncultured bacterium Contig178]
MSVGKKEKKEKRKRKDSKKILFQVGFVVFVGFSILIVLLGFLLVYNSRLSFFKGQQVYMKAQMVQVQEILEKDPFFDWVADMWDLYPVDMMMETTSQEYSEVAATPYLGQVSTEDIEALKKENDDFQKAVAKVKTLQIASRVMNTISMAGDQVVLIDIRKDKTGKIYLYFPYDTYPTDVMGQYVPEMIVNDIIAQKIGSRKDGQEEKYFADYKTEDGIYFYAGYAPIYSHGEARYAVVFMHQWTEERSEMINTVLWMLGILVVVLAIGGALQLLFISTATVGPVKRLRYGVRKYAKEKNREQLREDMTTVKSRNELDDLASEITDMAEEIDSYMNENIRLAGEREAAKAELSIATRVQKEQLPAEYPESPYFTLWAYIQPAREVGGDFYDFFLLDETHLMLLIADVSDKGMNAAFFMAISKSMIKTSAMNTKDPVEIITEAEKMLTENNPGGLFVTVWLAVIDLTTGHVDACNAGHDYPAIRKQGKYAIEKAPHGPAMAFLPGVPHVGTDFDLEPGDRIFLYTDGIVEAVNGEGERFGVERLQDTLNAASADASDEELIECIKSAVEKFAGETPQFDDMTMMSFTYRK